VSAIDPNPGHQVLVGTADIRGSDVTLDHFGADGAKRLTFLEIDSNEEEDDGKPPSVSCFYGRLFLSLLY